MLLVLFFLFGIGLVHIYSSSFIYASENFSDGLFFVKKQFLFTLVAIVVILILSTVKWHWVEKLAPVIFLFNLALLILTLVPGIGVKVGGAYRWLNLGFGFRIEPSEFMKISLPLLCASFLKTDDILKLNITNVFRFLLLLSPLLILLLQPDFGNFVVLFGILFCILFVFGLKWKYIGGLLIAACGLFFTLIWYVPYRKARLMAFLNPWDKPTGNSFQMVQSMMSFHNGGITGVGLGQGQGKLFFLPEAHTDFTLAVLGEEAGFIGVLFILFLFMYLILRGMQVVMQSKNTFAKVLALGLVSSFIIQSSINIGVALGLLPTKGMSLSFLSYGGSSLLSTSILFGLILNIKRNKILFSKYQKR